MFYNFLKKKVSNQNYKNLKPEAQLNHNNIIIISKINYPKSGVANQLWLYHKIVGGFENLFFTLFPHTFREYFGYFLLPRLLELEIIPILGSDKFTQIGGDKNDEIFFPEGLSLENSMIFISNSGLIIDFE